MIKQLALAAIAAGFLAQPAIAQSAPALAYTTGNLNMRTGPGTSYPVITTLPLGANVTVFGCTAGYNWCDAAYGNIKGWVSGNYLTYAVTGRYYRQPIPRTAVYIGVPVITRNITIYNPPVRPRGYKKPRPPRAVAPLLPPRPRAQPRPPQAAVPLQPNRPRAQPRRPQTAVPLQPNQPNAQPRPPRATAPMLPRSRS